MWTPFCVNGCWRLWDVGVSGSTHWCSSILWPGPGRLKNSLITMLQALDLESLPTSQEGGSCAMFREKVAHGGPMAIPVYT